MGKSIEVIEPREEDMADNWATVRHYEGITNPDEAAKRVREGFVPLISEHQGFVA